jgi:itaconyl-CoA hydratase
MAERDEMDFLNKATVLGVGHTYEDFEVGQEFVHHWGRTLNSGDNSLFTTLTLHYNPMYFNAPYARAHGHERLPVNPLLVFNTVLGLSVEDLSETGGPFLGISGCRYHATVYEGDTVFAKSTVLSKRESEKRPNSGIVSWATRGYNQEDKLVVEFTRTNLVGKRGHVVML